MLSSLKKMRGDKKGWYKVSDLVAGLEIARPRAEIDGSIEPSERSDDVLWDEIVSIKPVGREQVYDIQVEGTHNFVGNGIFAHNTYVLRANTMLAVEGEVNAGSFTVPIGSATGATSTSALGRVIPPEVLTVDGKGVDLFKLATYNLAVTNALSTRVDADEVRLTSLETRVDKLESGAIGSQTSIASSGSLTSIASALNELGVFISKGFAQFGTLIADRFVASVDSAGTSSAGTVNILAGNTVSQVTNAYVKPSTKIFITFNAPVAGSWYVSDKQDGSFKIILSEVQTADVSFDYFLVQTVGQMATSTPEVGGSQTSTPTSEAPTQPVGAGSVGDATGSESMTSSAPADTTPPVVTLVGDAAMQIDESQTFTDPGATAVDPSTPSNSSGQAGSGQATDLTASIVVTGAVDTATAGSYTLTYSATDAAGNVGSASRLVTVVAPAPASEPTPESATTEPTPTP